MSVAARRVYAVTLLLAAVFACAISSAAVVAYYRSAPPGMIVPGVFIAGIPVGGLTPVQAEMYVRSHVESRIGRPVRVYLGGDAWSVTPEELGTRVDLEGMVGRAHAVGRAGSPLRQLRERLEVARKGWNIPVEVKVDPDRLDAWLDAIAAKVERPPEDARLEVDATGAVAILPSRTGYRLDRERVAERLTYAILSEDDRYLRLTLEPVAPRLSTEGARALGIRTLLGAFTTRFDPSDFNRTQNIILSAESLDGLVIAPGETFSFNERVGPRIESAGYKEAPVIIDGELVPDIGGGVCQVSSTLYNAVLMAGLRVVQRVPHSIPSAYVPLGQDATVVYDTIDFKFANNTPGHVMIKAWTTRDEVTIAFYGDGPAYRSVRLESTVLSEIEPRVVEVTRTDLGPGERQIVKAGRKGYHVQVWRVAERTDGRVERTLVSQSSYRSSDRVIWVGAREEPNINRSVGEVSATGSKNAT